MYEKFYNLIEKPFKIISDPKYIYWSEKHQNALSYLLYGIIEQSGIVLLTGDIGSGKTTLINYLFNQLPEATDAVIIFNTNLTADELVKMVLHQFEIKERNSKSDNINALNEHLIENYQKKIKSILIVDEAQSLSEEALEEIRMLTNLQSENSSLIQIILVGQPELREVLKRKEFRQVAQRIAASYHLTGLDRENTEQYIQHRLKVAGGDPSLFTKAAIDLIFDLSGGLPRLINMACQAALVYGFAEEATKISQDIIKKIIDDKIIISPYLEVNKEIDKSNIEPIYDQKEVTKKINQIWTLLLELRNNFNDLLMSINKLQPDELVGNIYRAANLQQNENGKKVEEKMFQILKSRKKIRKAKKAIKKTNK